MTIINFRAEDWNRDGNTVKIERPVLQLERDHNAFDQVLRRHTFTKSFAFFIFPPDGGLEKVKSSHPDQLFTVPRMGAVLVQTINDYGHAYDNSEIDKLFEILSDLVKHEEFSPKAQDIRKDNKSRSKVIRIFSALVLIAAIVLSFLFILAEKNPSNHLPISSTANPSSTVSFAEKRADYSLSISSIYAPLFDACSQDALDRIAATINCHSIKRQSDGAIQIDPGESSKAQVVDTAASTFTEIITHLFNTKALPDFSSIRINNHSQFTVFVTSQSHNSNESVIIEEMLRLGVLFSVLEDHSPELFSIVFLSQEGQELHTITLNSFMNH